MMRAVGLLLLAVALVSAAQVQKAARRPAGRKAGSAVAFLPATQVENARPNRAGMAAVETAFDARVRTFNAMDPMELFSSTQGVYLEGYGAVFTAQVDLIMTPTVTPWRQKITKEDIQNIHGRKVARLAAIKAQMREVLTIAALVLDGMPANENVVLAVSLYRFAWEDTAGLPAQIVMQAARQKLLKRPLAEDAIQTQEF
jgi:hypothetical protein